MPVYNAEKYLREAIESILQQTFTDFEFLIIDDGSTDASAAIIKLFSDPRIVYLKNEFNLGLAASLNKGLELARGEFIARMDADDISLPNRLATQYAFLQNHPEIDLCGSGIKYIDAHAAVKKNISDPLLIPPTLLFSNCLFHPTVFFRLAKFKELNLRYDANYKKCQDYELWSRAALSLKMTNLKKVLLLYRTGGEEKEYSPQGGHWRNFFQAAEKKSIQRLLPSVTDEDLKIHFWLNGVIPAENKLSLKDAESWLLKLQSANQNKKIYQEKYLRKALSDQWLIICRREEKNKLKALKIFISSPLCLKDLSLPAKLIYLLLK